LNSLFANFGHAIVSSGPLEMTMQEGRVAGKSAMGRLRMGQIVNPTATQRASIPSKFETILNTGTREKDGFNRRTHRFDETENELPGPGFYHQPSETSSFIKDPKGEYTSKRGTAAFASGEKRWYEAPRPLFVPPGPGRYQGNHDMFQQLQLQAPPALRTKPSAVFVPPTAKRAVPKATSQSPGPGSYDVATNISRADRESAIFRSTTKRNEMTAADKDLPGPGTYSDALMQYKSVTEVAAQISARPAYVSNPLDPDRPRPAPPVTAAVFRSGTNRDGKPIRKEEPPIDAMNLPPMPGHAAAPLSPSKPSHPAAVEPAAADGERIQRPSSMFAPTTLDRFGRPTVKFSLLEGQTPGPGQYDKEDDRDQKQLITSSWAMSGVDRFPKRASKRQYKPPGPAFYKPKDMGKISFHANARGSWV